MSGITTNIAKRLRAGTSLLTIGSITDGQFLKRVGNTIVSAAVAVSGAITSSGLTMATNKLLGRGTAGTGAVEEITLGTNLSLTGTTLNAAGGSITVGDTQVLFADGANNPAGDAGMVYDKTANVLTTAGGFVTTGGVVTLKEAGTYPVLNSAASANSGVFLNGLSVGFSISGTARLDVTTGAVTFLVPPIPPTYTVSTLPTPAAGMIAYVTDGDGSLAWGATVVNTGAGATKYLVWWNGTNWTVFAK